jgi:hypothetical protein
MRITAKKIIAFLLLLLFIEKAGLRLWVHTHYHICSTSSKNSKASYPSFSKEDCDCIDDFFIPLSFADEIIVSIPVIEYCDLFPIHYKSFISSPYYLSFQLRGPPFIV